MPDWLIWIWIGPLIAVLLARQLRPAYLVVLGLASFAGFFAAFKAAEKLYPDCLDTGCPPGDHRLSVLAAILFLLGAALLLLSLAKVVFRTRSSFSAKPS